MDQIFSPIALLLLLGLITSCGPSKPPETPAQREARLAAQKQAQERRYENRVTQASKAPGFSGTQQERIKHFESNRAEFNRLGSTLGAGWNWKCENVKNIGYYNSNSLALKCGNDKVVGILVQNGTRLAVPCEEWLHSMMAWECDRIYWALDPDYST